MMISWLVSPNREAEYATALMTDLRSRLANRVRAAPRPRLAPPRLRPSRAESIGPAGLKLRHHQIFTKAAPAWF